MGFASSREKQIERYLEEAAKTRRAVRAHKPSDDYWRGRLQACTNECRKACAELRPLKRILSDRRLPIAERVAELEEQVRKLQDRLLDAEHQHEKQLNDAQHQHETRVAKTEQPLKALREENRGLRAENERLRGDLKSRSSKQERTRTGRELVQCRKELASVRNENNRLRTRLEEHETPTKLSF